jgi:hypothetical protein
MLAAARHYLFYRCLAADEDLTDKVIPGRVGVVIISCGRGGESGGVGGAKCLSFQRTLSWFAGDRRSH